jgi:hypothetical protein
MTKMTDTKGRYFSVKYSMKIQGVRYIPAVCYPLPPFLQDVVADMAAKDMATVYTEKMRFVTGVPYPVRKPEAAVLTQPSSVSAPKVSALTGKTPATTEGRHGKRTGKIASPVQVNRDFA